MLGFEFIGFNMVRLILDFSKLVVVLDIIWYYMLVSGVFFFDNYGKIYICK